VHPLRLGELQARRRARTRYRQRLRVAARDGEAKEATAGGDGTRNIRLRAAQRSKRSWRVSAARKTQSAAQHYAPSTILDARSLPVALLIRKNNSCGARSVWCCTIAQERDTAEDGA
jgi:hypothetical protein